MTLAAAVPINSYLGNGSTNTYPFTFPVFTQDQIAVTVTTNLVPAVTYALRLGTDYTVAGLNATGDPATTGSITLVNGGQAWLTSGNLISGYSLTITRAMALAQNTSIRNQGDLYRSTLENVFDSLVMIIQQQQVQLNNLIPIPGSANLIPGGVLTLADTTNGHVYKLLMINGSLTPVMIS